MKINEDLIKNVINVDTSINNKSRVNFIKGKNLMQIKTIGNTTISGITYSISNDGTITLNGTATARVDFGYLLEPLKSFANECYCLSYIYISGTLTDGQVSVYNQDQNYNWYGYNIELSKNRYSSMCDLKSMPKDLNMKDAAIIRVGNGSVLNNLKFKLMFIKSKTPDYNYEPYVAPSIVVDGGEIYGKVEHKIFKKTVTTSGWSTPLKLEDYNGYDFITFYIKSSDFSDIITLPIDVLKLRITDNAYIIKFNNKQYMSVGMYDTSIMLYRGYADSIEIILWK